MTPDVSAGALVGVILHAGLPVPGFDGGAGLAGIPADCCGAPKAEDVGIVVPTPCILVVGGVNPCTKFACPGAKVSDFPVGVGGIAPNNELPDVAVDEVGWWFGTSLPSRRMTVVVETTDNVSSYVAIAL